MWAIVREHIQGAGPTRTYRSFSCAAAARRLAAAVSLCALGSAAAASAVSPHIENGVAVFAALDKVTARISKLEIKLNESVRFGALKVTPRACYSRPPTETPKTTTFVEIDEMQLDGTEKRIFTGWMFAESPGLNALEHPVFDVWLTGCAEPLRGVAGQPKGSAQGEQPPADTSTGDDLPHRRRPRR